MSWKGMNEEMRLNPHCQWCERRVFRDVEMSGLPYPAQATIDHVKCKQECDTKAEYSAAKNKVLACYACNQRRNAQFMQSPQARIYPAWMRPKSEPMIVAPAVAPRRTLIKTGEVENKQSKRHVIHAPTQHPKTESAFRASILIETSVGIPMPIGYIRQDGSLHLYGRLSKIGIWR